MPLRNLIVRIGADTSNMAKGLKNAQNQLGAFGSHVNGLMKGIKGQLAGAVAGLFTGMTLKQGIDDAIRYEALMGTLGETMGKSREDFIKWQETVGSTMGFSKLEAADLASKLSLNFKSIATSQQDLTDKTEKMMEAAAIISNKRGMLMSEVSDRIRSAMAQEADGADELGVNVRIAALEQSKAYKQMADGTPWDKLSTNMQKTILYYHILDSVSANLGDTIQNNTQLKMANFTASLQDVRMALGSAFLPILNVILPVLTTFMRWLETGLKYVYAFSKAIIEAFGGHLGAFSQSINTATTSAQGLSNAVSGAGDGLDNATKSAKKLGSAAKKAAKEGANLQSFDEVHLLDPTDTGGGDTGGGGGGGGKGAKGGGGGGQAPPSGVLGMGGLDNTKSIFDDIGKNVEKLANKFKNWLKTSEGIKTIRQGLDSIRDGFVDIFTSKAVRWFAKQIAEDLPSFFDDLGIVAGGILKALGGKLEEIGGYLDKDMNKQWKGWGDNISGVYDIATGTIGLLFPDLGKKLAQFGNLFDKSWKAFGDQFVNGSTSWGQVWDKFTNALKLKFGINMAAMTLQGASNMADLKNKMIKNIADAIGDHLKKFNTFKTSVSGTLTWIKNNHTAIFDGIKAIIKKRMEDAYADFKRPFSGVATWFKNNVSNPIHSALSGINKGLDGGMGGALRSAYNSIAKRINGMLGGIASIGVGGNYPFKGIVRYALPPLAKGGITAGPMAAWIGDNASGHEVVAPLERLQPMLVQAVQTAMAFNKTSGVGGDIVLNLDGRTFARIIKPHIETENKRVGTNIRLNPI